MRAFVTAFGRRAWRGPLEPASIARFTDLGTAVGTSLDDFYLGARHAAAGLLQSPGFLYRVELATAADPADPKRRRFPSRAMASRLSYLLWNTTPDAELLAAVDRDDLATAAGVRAQADRLLRSPRASAALGNFAQEMFQLYRLDTLPKDAKLFPQMTPALRAAMSGELLRLYQRTIERDIDATELFDTAEAAVTADLAKLYGLPDGAAKGTTFTPVTLPPDGVRAGVLGTSALMALYAKQNETSPTARGRLVREAFLCQHVPDPPGDVDTTIKDPPAGVVLTTRQKFEMHRASPTCAACHSVLDPIGFALESFDPIGAFRATDHGKPIDPSGVLDGQAFANARDLGRVLRGHPDARRCLARQMYRYAAGHRETGDEEAFIAALDATTAAAGGRMKALLLEMVSSDAFRYATP
jgi:hypothetical protein